MDSEMFWFNFNTKQYDYRNVPLSLEEALPYIPDNPAARAIFRLNVEHFGMDVLHAMLDVYERCLAAQKSSDTNHTS